MVCFGTLNQCSHGTQSLTSAPSWTCTQRSAERRVSTSLPAITHQTGSPERNQHQGREVPLGLCPSLFLRRLLSRSQGIWLQQQHIFTSAERLQDPHQPWSHLFYLWWHLVLINPGDRSFVSPIWADPRTVSLALSLSTSNTNLAAVLWCIPGTRLVRCQM